MPELIEVEMYLKSARRTVGRTVSSVALPDPQYLKGEPGLDALQSSTHNQNLKQVRRIGKLLILEVGNISLGLRFGMTGLSLIHI